MTERDYRASCISLGLPFRILPDPDGSVEALDRQMMVYLYAKVLLEPIVVQKVYPRANLIHLSFQGNLGRY